MIDREKVIKGLECCIARNGTCQYKQEPICPYVEHCQKEDYAALQRDALALLKKQEPKAYLDGYAKYGDALRHCPSCETTLPNSGIYGKSNFCYRCGQAVK